MKPSNFCKVQTSHSKQRPSSPKRPFIEWQQPFLFSEVRKLKNVTNMHSFSREKKGAFYVRYLYLDFFFQAVFERLVDIICDKMSESLDSDPTLNTNKGTRLDNAQPSSMNCNC